MAAAGGGSAGPVHSVHLPPCQASTALVYPGDGTEDHSLVDVSQNHLYGTVTSKIPLSLKDGWGRVPGVGVFKGLERRTRPCSPKLSKLRFCFQSLMDSYHSAGRWFDHTPGLEAIKRLDMSYSNLNFFSKGNGNAGDKYTQTTLSHGWEHLF